MIIKPKYYGPAIPSTYAVTLTAAGSGSNGVTIADDADIDMATNDFTPVWIGAVPDWTPSAAQRLWFKTDGANGVTFNIGGSGASNFMSLAINGTGYNSTVAPGATVADGAIAMLAASVARSSAGAAGSVNYYLNQSPLGAAVSIPIGAPVTVNNAVAGYVAGNSTIRTASTNLRFMLYNRALSAADILALYQTGQVAAADVGASQTALTSGTLTTGLRYKIDTFVAGDSFTNVGAASNATGVEFIATGTTPTTWTNSSSLRHTGCVLDLNGEGIATGGATGWTDATGNTGGGTLPAAGATKVTIRK